MSKKKLETSGIISELKQGSVFFQPGKSTVRPQRGERDVRGVRPPPKRERKRHPFDIYRDQLETLKQLKSEHMMKTGEEKSMAEMVREALDTYIHSNNPNSKRTSRTGRTLPTGRTEK
jgi:hypothetical protein